MAKSRKRSLWATAEKEIGKPVGELNIDDILSLPLYTQTSDNRGGSAVLSAQVDARLGRVIQEQWNSPNTPYKTPSDYLRDALYTFALVCQQKYFDGESASEWQRLLELQKNKMQLHFRNQIREEANEFARDVIEMAESSPEEAAKSVERQVLNLVGEDDYASQMYLGAMYRERVQITLDGHLGKNIIKLIEQQQ